MVDLKLHPDVARGVALKLLETLNGKGIFGHKKLPDDVAKELFGGTDEEVFLNFITLTTALDYMRSADKLWESSVKTLEDGEVNWVFSPKAVVEAGKEKLKTALLKHKLALKKDRDTEIWFQLSKTLYELYGGSTKRFLESYGYDVDRMFRDITKKENKEKFPSLSGVKIFPHWIRSLRDKVNLPFKNLHKLPIPVDVHVARATFTTGCITGKYSSKGVNETVRRRIIKVWQEGLEGTGIAPVEMFRPLWLLSKHGCRFRKDGDRPKIGECPVREFCVEGKVIVTSGRLEIDT